MNDGSEALRTRIDNLLSTEGARLERVRSGGAKIAIKEVTRDFYSIGSVGKSQRQHDSDKCDYFLETPVDGAEFSRQLWLPAPNWSNSAAITQREIVVTFANSARRLDAWRDARTSMYNLDNYSIFSRDTDRLLKEVGLTLHCFGDNSSTITQ